MKQKYYVELNRQEWRLIIEGLSRFRNKLIAAGRYTDAVDEIFQSRQGKAAEVNVVGMEALMMEKYITDERTGLKYELVGDYYLIAGEDEPEEDQPIGILGAAAFTLFETPLQGNLCKFADKRQATRISCGY